MNLKVKKKKKNTFDVNKNIHIGTTQLKSTNCPSTFTEPLKKKVVAKSAVFKVVIIPEKKSFVSCHLDNTPCIPRIGKNSENIILN